MVRFSRSLLAAVLTFPQSGTYVGTRPVRIKKATTGVAAVEIGNKKAAVLDKKSRGKSGTISFEKANEAIQNSGNSPGQGSSGNSGGFGPDKNRKSYIRR